MSTEVGSLHYDLDIDGKKLKSQLDDADKSVKSFGDRLSKHWNSSVAASKKLLLGVAAVGAATVGFGVASVKAFNESQQALTQLDSVLKSTGGAAGVTRDAAIKLSKEIQRTTSISDEAALAVENMGLTFTAIHKDIFPKATKAAIDMATAMNHGLKPSAEQSADAMKLLGKALQDPDAGLGALHRVGVNTEELKKKFVGLTDITQKQKLILQELGTEFGGSAAAQARTFSGRVDQIKNAFNDLQEQVGEVIVKALAPVADWFSRVVQRISDAGGMLQIVKNFWQEHKSVIVVVAGALMGALLPALISISIAFGELLLTLAPWAALGAGVVLLAQKMGISFSDVQRFAEELRNKFIGLGISFQDIKNVMTGAVNVLKDVWHWFDSLPPAVQLLIWPLGFLVASFDLVKNIVMTVVDIFMKWFWPSIQALALSLYQNLIPALAQMWDAVVRLWNALNPALMDALKIIAIIIGVALIGALWLVINVLNVAITIFAAVISVVSNVIKWITNLIRTVGVFAVEVGRAVREVLGWFERIPGYISSLVSTIARWFGGLPKAIGTAISTVGDVIKRPFKTAFDWIQQQIDRLVGLLGKLKGAVSSVINAPSNAAKGIGGLLSKIPGFATGGIVPGPVGAPMLAVVHGGEEVIPNGKAGGGFTLNIGTINDRSDADYIIRRVDHNQRLEARGISPI